MKDTIEEKLNTIKDIWNDFIFENDFCSKQIKFNSDIKTNYFGDIIGYFKDTFDIVFSQELHSNYSAKFSFTISFLQAIYIQQDFIEEMLDIFEIPLNKGNLKNDSNYSINREIRNELIGHPIRKLEGNLISSTFFCYQSNINEIQYSRYHKDNNFKLEEKNFNILEIQIRHQTFLAQYLDIIIQKLKNILRKYLKKISHVEKVINNGNFETTLKLASIFFESIFTFDYIYNKECLLKIYSRKMEHFRYKNLIERFYKDLNSSIIDTKNLINEFLIVKKTFDKNPINEETILELFSEERLNYKPIQDQSYNYHLGKIASKNSYRDFQFHSNILRKICQENILVINELDHMELNFEDDIEYYTSFRLISTELKEDE